MPDHADAPVARLAAGLRPPRTACSSQRSPPSARPPAASPHRHVHRVELVVARHLLDERCRRPSSSKTMKSRSRSRKRRFSNTPSMQHLQLGQVRIGQALARDRPPGHEPLAPGGERADARLHAVGDDEQLRCRRRATGSPPCRSGAGGRPSRWWRSRRPGSSARSPPAAGR